MRIQHNIAALNSYRNLGVNNSGVAKNLEKLSSGFRINRAGDDAAGLAISEKMRSQITGLNTATKNANDGISLVQTAEGALTEVHSMLNRMVEIATQSANGVYEDGVDRQALQDEMNALTDEIDRIAEGTNFNKQNLLNGTLDTSATRTYTQPLNPGSQAGNDGKVGMDLEFKFIDTVTGKAAPTVTFAKGTGSEKKCDIEAATGNITLTIGEDLIKTEGNVVSSSEIQKLIRDKASGVADEKVKDILSNITVSGEGITGTAKATEDTAINAPTNAKVDKEGEALNLQIGDSSKDFNKLKVTIGDMHAEALGIQQKNGDEGISVATEEEAGAAVDKINEAINTVSTQRGKLGAIQNRLEHTINNLSVNAENMTAAESRIRDVDMADEMMKYTKNNILVQASQAMLAQANQVPQGVLQLLQ